MKFDIFSKKTKKHLPDEIVCGRSDGTTASCVWGGHVDTACVWFVVVEALKEVLKLLDLRSGFIDLFNFLEKKKMKKSRK